MPRIFGERSTKNLNEAHPALQRVARRALELTTQDFTIIEGHRPEREQNEAVARGASKVRYPNSAHNQQPSCAIDVIPYPFKGWDDADIHKELGAVAKAFMQASRELGIAIRWGADWNRNGRTDDESFVDSPHFELHPWREWAK